MNNPPKVFAIVLNYNGKDCLISCLDSLYSSDYPNLEVVVVDNNSSDDSFALARKRFSKYHFIQNSENIGFSAGNNVAIRFALEKMADYILLLNNDAVIEKNSIKKLVGFSESNSKVGIASPVIYNENTGKIWFAGGKIIWKKMKSVHINQIVSQKPYETEYASGCCALIKKDVFAKIGLFDEKFFLYYEDADFSWRAIKEGFAIYMVPGAHSYHLERSSINKNKLYWLVLSGLIFFNKNSLGINKTWVSAYSFARKIKLKIRGFRGDKTEPYLLIKKAFADYKKQ